MPRAPDPVALHEDPLRALDHRPALERVLELADLLGQLRASAWRRTATSIARLEALGVGSAASAESPRSAAASANAASASSRTAMTGPVGRLGELVDRVERVTEVAVDDDDRDVGLVVTINGTPRSTEAVHAVTSWPSCLEQRGGAFERLRILVGGEDAQPASRRFRFCCREASMPERQRPPGR